MTNSFLSCPITASRLCLSTSSNSGYYYYAFFMQMLFVISGATSLFIAVVMYWYNDNRWVKTHINLSHSLSLTNLLLPPTHHLINITAMVQ